MAVMRLFGRGRGERFRRPSGEARTGSTRVRAASNDDEEHLAAFVASREGVEGYVEPRTAMSDVTLLLVAWDGEYTRRRVPSADWAYKFCRKRGIRAYEAGVVGIPQHMRDYIRRQKQQGS
jgi:hypothetical protein